MGIGFIDDTFELLLVVHIQIFLNSYCIVLYCCHLMRISSTMCVLLFYFRCWTPG